MTEKKIASFNFSYFNDMFEYLFREFMNTTNNKKDS